MVRPSPHILYKFIFVAVVGVLIVALSHATVNAQGNNQFPGITGTAADWTSNPNSPDPNLTWLYKANGPNEVLNGNTTHILRTRSAGRNEGTRLRLYFTREPKKVSISVNVITCDLDAPGEGGTDRGYDGAVKVVLGGEETYNERTHDGRYNDSPVCENHGNDRRKLDNRTFSVDFRERNDGKMGRDTLTNLYFADLDIDLTSDNDDTDANGLPENESLMQRVTFKVKANNVDSVTGRNLIPKMGYRYFDDEANASRFFGLQGNGGRDNDFNGYGVKFAIPFGMDCNDPRNSIPGKIIVYDPDVNFYGPVYMKVFRRNPDTGAVTLLKDVGQNGDYEALANATYRNNGEWIEATAGNNQNSAFTVKGMEKGYQYMLVVINPHQSDEQDPSSNVFSLRLPTNSINGLIDCRYNLIPKLSNVNATFSAYGDTLNPHASIENAETGTHSGDHGWRVTRAVFSSRPTDLNRTVFMDQIDAPCRFITAQSGPPLDCKNDVYTGTYPADEAWVGTDTLSLYPVGTYVCYITSVQDPTWKEDDNNQWRHSAMECSVSVKKPRIQFLGSDLRVGGTAISSYYNVRGNNYGSWSEYAIFTLGSNSLVSSGNSLRNGNADPESQWNKLTFANTPSYGGYNPLPSASSAYTYFKNIAATGGGLNQSAPASGVYDFAAGDNLGAMSVNSKSTSVIIRKVGTLRISDNITVANNGVTGADNLSQVVLVADNIVIDPTVTRIDAWLVTSPTGYINTCNGAALPLTSATCPNPLEVNGAIYTGTMRLLRTAGANPPEASIKDPAERFNLRPDAVLWAHSYANKADYAQTDFVQELPPRY